MTGIFQYLRHAVRQLCKSPGFAAVAVATLALGIGANTAIFTLVHAVMLKSLPVGNPKQLYSLGDYQTCCDTTSVQQNFSLFSHGLYQQIKQHSPEFSDLAAFQSWEDSWSVRRSGAVGLTEPYFGEYVSGNYFSTLGVEAFAGRAFTPADDQPNAAPAAVMSYRTWKQHFAQDPSVVGSTFTMNGQPITIVGVAPPNFFGDTLRANPPDFWVPLSIEPVLNHDNSLLNSPNEYWLFTIGRVKPGAQPMQAQARITTEIQRWLANQTGLSPEDRQQISKVRVFITPAGGGVTRLRNANADGLRLLMVISALVLLIACANVANLLLARGTTNRLQTALRVALGATRGRLIRQMLVEGLVLSTIGGIAGVVLAYGGTRAILRLAFQGAQYVPIDSNPSLAVLAFAFLLALVTGVIFSIGPAWISSQAQPTEPLRGAGRSTRDHSALPQRSLVVLQTALSLVLLVGAGLLTRSLRNLQAQSFGFETQGRLIVRINPALAGYTPERLQGLYQQLTQQFSQLPGVLSASIALHTPMDNWNWNTAISVEGRPPSASPNEDNANYNWVGAHFFETLGTRLLRGRVIDEHDTPASHYVTVINRSLASKFFPHEDAIGKHLGLAEGHAGDYEIVGIVEDSKYLNPQAPALPMFFIPLLQMAKYEKADDARYQVWANYIDSIQLRVAGSPENIQALVRKTLADINPNLTVISMRSLDEQVGNTFNSQRLVARLTTVYGLLAIILACIGLYGVAAYMVARRTREIGIRMALGADRGTVLAMVLRRAMSPIALGLAIGIPAVLAGGRAIASQLYGVKGYDPFILTSATVALAVAALIAALVPARRATKVDPMVALRYE
jgi:predicted permease